MHVVAKQLITGEVRTFPTLKDFCKKLSIKETSLQQSFAHPVFKDGIYQKFSIFWWRIDVMCTLEECLTAIKQKPLKTIVIDKYSINTF